MAEALTQGQRHERIPKEHDGANVANAKSATGGDDISVGQKMLSAVAGALLTSVLVTPLDVVRVRLQAQKSPLPSRLPSFIQLPPNLGVSACCREVFWVQNASQFCVAAPSSAAAAHEVIDARIISDCAAEETQRRSFNSTLDGLKKIARNEGIFTLWRGLSPTLMMAVPGNVIYFAGYDWLRSSKWSPMHGRVSDVYAPLVAGSSARVAAACVVSPLEMLRTRMQATASIKGQGGVMRATVNGLRDMVATDGLTSLWRGLTLTLWRDVPFSAFYWWGYEYGRENLHAIRRRQAGILGKEHKHELSHSALLQDSFVAGAGAGGIAALFTTPFDVGKTRQQVALQHGSGDVSQSMIRLLYQIYRNEGMNGLFRGWAARAMKVAPSCAIMISTYEIGKSMARNANEATRNAAEN